MQESTRLQYLALLGIEQWLPRDAVPEASGEIAAAAGAAPLPSPSAAMDRLDALLSQPAAALPDTLAHAVNDEPVMPLPVVQEPRPVAAPVPARVNTSPLPAGDRIACSLLFLPGGLLLVADFARPDAPGLSSAEHTMFLRLAAALVPGQPLPAPRDFTWPPAGVRVPGMDRPGAAGEALRALLEEQRRRGLREIAVLGDGAGQLLRALAGDLGLPAPACTLSLATMVAEPDRKRECWAVLSPLRRDAAT